jgi:hypothetical protein
VEKDELQPLENEGEKNVKEGEDLETKKLAPQAPTSSQQVSSNLLDFHTSTPKDSLEPAQDDLEMPTAPSLSPLRYSFVKRKNTRFPLVSEARKKVS